MTEKIEPSKYTFTAAKPNHSVTFSRPPNNEQIGRLDFNGEKMTFEGESDESAKIFFNFLAEWFAKRLEEERAAEREKCAKVCEDINNPTFEAVAAAIRARGEKNV